MGFGPKLWASGEDETDAGFFTAAGKSYKVIVVNTIQQLGQNRNKTPHKGKETYRD
jgi:hypothetical protein